MDDAVYKECILELYRNPLNRGVLEKPDATARDVSTSCGDDIEIFITLDRQGRVLHVLHTGHGCAISQAAVSLLTEEIKGKTKDEIFLLTKKDVIGMLGVPISYTREGCAMLGLKVTRQALEKV